MTVVSHRAETNRRMSTMCRTLCASFRQLMARRRFRSEYQRALFEFGKAVRAGAQGFEIPNTPRVLGGWRGENDYRNVPNQRSI